MIFKGLVLNLHHGCYIYILRVIALMNRLLPSVHFRQYFRNLETTIGILSHGYLFQA